MSMSKNKKYLLVVIVILIVIAVWMSQCDKKLEYLDMSEQDNLKNKIMTKNISESDKNKKICISVNDLINKIHEFHTELSDNEKNNLNNIYNNHQHIIKKTLDTNVRVEHNSPK